MRVNINAIGDPEPVDMYSYTFFLEYYNDARTNVSSFEIVMNSIISSRQTAEAIVNCELPSMAKDYRGWETVKANCIISLYKHFDYKSVLAFKKLLNEIEFVSGHRLSVVPNPIDDYAVDGDKYKMAQAGLF